MPYLNIISILYICYPGPDFVDKLFNFIILGDITSICEINSRV